MSRQKRVRIAESALAVIRSASLATAPNETGGILVGVRVEGGLWVTHAIEVKPALGVYARYEIPAGVTPGLVRAARAKDKRIGYLGDWHSHPEDVGASSTDRHTMARLARSLRASHVMIVALPDERGYHFDSRVVTPFREYLVPLELTGDLA